MSRPLRPGTLLAGRFEMLTDSAVVLGRRGYRSGEAIREHESWATARDRVTGATVRVRPRGRRPMWLDDVARESLAREAAALGLPAIVPVLHAGPGVVYAEPPPMTARQPLPRAHAAACALAACEVLAHLHARGFAGEKHLFFGAFNLRVDSERAQIAWLVPGIPAVDHRSPHDDDYRDLFELPTLAPIAAGVRRLLRLFFALAPSADAEPVTREAQRHALATLDRLRDGSLSFETVPSVAALARLLRELAPAERTAAIPVVDAVPPRRVDFDALVADGEAELALGSIPSGIDSDRYIALPLASAYHQRACRSFARGELAAALADVGRACQLDDFPTYRTTQAALLDALGRSREARAVIVAAIAGWPPPAAWDEAPELERARALALRGAFALRDGDLELAETDLSRAFELSAAPAHAYHLGAARYARGDLAGALTAEARAVELEPTCPRYRWALAVTLHELGRADEALVHAREACARDPAYHARLVRRFGPAT